MTLSSFFFMGAGLTLVLSLTLVFVVLFTTTGGAEYIQMFQDALPGMLLTLASISSTLVVQLFVNRLIFFVGPRGNKWIRFRFWYAPH